MSLDGLAAIRREPNFKAAAQQLAQSYLDQDAALDPATQWLVHDTGRLILYGAALILESALGQLSVADLQRAAAMADVCSPGRVIAFVEYAAAAGQIEIPPGHLIWTQRPLGLRTAFWRYGEERLWLGLAAAALLELDPLPEPPPALRRGATKAAFSLMTQLLTVHPHLSNGRAYPMGAVIDHNAGVSILYDWFLQQPVGQAAFLKRVHLNKSALARRHRVSRPHVANLIESLKTAELVSLSDDGTIVISSKLSEDLERHFAQGLQMIRAGGLAARAVLNATDHRPSDRSATF